MGDEDANYTQYFTIENFGVNQPGIYFENYGPTRIIGGEYKLITYLSLVEYNSKYEELGENIIKLTNNCNEIEKITPLCNRYQSILVKLFNEITVQKERMFLSLGEVEEEKNEQARRKRGLINFVGSAMNTLFGVCDDNCVQGTTEAIKKSEENGGKILHIMEAQTTVVKAAIKKIGITTEQTQLIYDDLRNKERILYETMGAISNTTEQLEEVLQTTEIQNLYALLTNQYAYETATINNIVTAARGGVIHTSLMTPQDIAKTLKEISYRLRNKLHIPMGTKTTELYELQKIREITVYYKNGQIIFITTIPLVTDTELTMYNLIPIPVNRPNLGYDVILVIENPYIAITKNRKQYITFTEQQKYECKETRLYRICTTTQPIQENNETPICEIDLFNKPEMVSEMCKPKVTFIDRSIYHKLRYQNNWIYVVKGDTLTINCLDIPEPQIKRINGTGIIKLINEECQVHTKQVTLTPIRDLTNLNYIDFIPKTKMENLFNKLPISPHIKLNKWDDRKEIKLSNLHEVSNSVDEIEKMIENEVERERTNTHKTIHNNLLYITIVILIMSILALVITYIMTKMREKKLTPTLVTRHVRIEPQTQNYELGPLTSPPPPPSPR